MIDKPLAPVPATASTAEADLSGWTVDDFRVIRRLGQGGMGQVYLAEQLSLKRPVALKVLRPELAANPASRARFRAEAETVARAAHPNIVQVYACAEWRGLLYMALEYVEGVNLRDFVARKGPPAPATALGLMRQVAAALQRAGELGIVHRDIKPENILLNRKGEVKVADFGLSRFLDAPEALALTQSGVTLGTPLYMSPEQVEGKPLDPRTDIYSFGVTAYQMLTGDPPFRGQTAFEVALRHVQDEPPDVGRLRPDLPTELCAVVRKMMAKRPDQRYQTGGELVRALKRVQVEGSTALALAPENAPDDSSMDTAVVPISPVAAPPAWGRHRWWAVIAASAVLAVAAGAALGWQRPARSVETSAAEPFLESGPAAHREQFLREAVAEYATPKDANETELGFGHRVELGLLYLGQWRLTEAERFFRGLEDSAETVKSYGVLGHLGHAIVLALQDRAEESVHLFQETVHERDAGLGRLRFLLNRNPRFLRAIALALDRDAANLATSGKALSPALEELRKPRPVGASGAGRVRRP